MKPVDLRAAGLSDDPADRDGVNAEPRPEVAPDFDPIASQPIPGDRWNGTAGGPEETGVCGCGHSFVDHHAGNVDPLECYAVVRHSGNADVFCACERYEPVTAPPTPGEWKISDLTELDRVLARMARLKRLQSENEMLVRAEVKRLGEWLEKEDEALAKRYRDLEAHVYEFARDNRGTLGKTRRLPHGVVSWKERKEGAYRLDPKMTPHAARVALLGWAQMEEARRSNWKFTEPLVVEGPPEVDLAEMKRYLALLRADTRITVETPPGLEWVPPGETLSIVVEEKKR